MPSEAMVTKTWIIEEASRIATDAVGDCPSAAHNNLTAAVIELCTRVRDEGRSEGMAEAAEIAKDRQMLVMLGGSTGSAEMTAINITKAIERTLKSPQERKVEKL